MLAEVIQQLWAHRARIRAEIQERQAQLARIEQALRTLGVAERGQKTVAPARKPRRKMSLTRTAQHQARRIEAVRQKGRSPKTGCQNCRAKSQTGRVNSLPNTPAALWRLARRTGRTDQTISEMRRPCYSASVSPPESSISRRHRLLIHGRTNP